MPYNRTSLTRLCFLDFKLSPVLNVVFFLLGDSPGSEFYMPTFRNTVNFIFIGGVPKITQKGRIQECVLCYFLGGGVICRRLNFICRRFGTLSVPSS